MMKVIANIEAGAFPIWPLAVLYHISEDQPDKEALRKMIAKILQNMYGATVTTLQKLTIYFWRHQVRDCTASYFELLA